MVSCPQPSQTLQPLLVLSLFFYATSKHLDHFQGSHMYRLGRPVSSSPLPPKNPWPLHFAAQTRLYSVLRRREEPKIVIPLGHHTLIGLYVKI
jgi:hypothetical protein